MNTTQKNLLNFNVGPSKVSDATKRDIQRSVDEQVLELSHRGAAFSDICRDAVEELQTFLAVPDGYTILFTDSATRAMELALFNTCRAHSFHFVNGSFSQLFYSVAQAAGKEAIKSEVPLGSLHDFRSIVIPSETEYISLTQNETSTGVICDIADITYLHSTYPDALLAVDITSSVGMYEFNFDDADMWLFSVQKGFGLPAGLGVLIVSDRALERSRQIGHERAVAQGYFSFDRMAERMQQKFQTVQTPNVFGIFLLAEKLKRWNARGGIGTRIRERDEKWELFRAFFDAQEQWSFFADKPEWTSRSVLCLQAPQEQVARYHHILQRNQIVSGKGYGPLKDTTVRVANFPAISIADVKHYLHVLESASL